MGFEPTPPNHRLGSRDPASFEAIAARTSPPCTTRRVKRRAWVWMVDGIPARSPSGALLPFLSLGKGSPTKID